MAHNSDSATSNLLLCSENSSTCFDDDLECCDAADGSNSRISHQFWDHHEGGGGGGSELLACFVALSEETVRAMVEREREHLPRDDYLMRLRSGELDLGVRREAIDWICKVLGFVDFWCLIHFQSMGMKRKQSFNENFLFFGLFVDLCGFLPWWVRSF